MSERNGNATINEKRKSQEFLHKKYNVILCKYKKNEQQPLK